MADMIRQGMGMELSEGTSGAASEGKSAEAAGSTGVARGMGARTQTRGTLTPGRPVAAPKAQRAQTPGMELEVATFRADVTPPVGEVLDCGFDPPVKTVEHPLLAKGVVLRNRGGVYVLCALDWGGLCNSAYDLFRQRIAQAVGTSPSRVAVQCLHQHTAPAVDSNAQRILDEVEGAPLHANAKFVEASAGRVADALHGLVWRRATHIGTGWASVDRVASSRRILQPDGTILARLSSTRDPEQQVAPEGKVDGYLRTVGFYEGEKPIVQMHYYATHPQSYYRDGRVTYDVPGLARERLEDESGVFQLYFTGCAGDVAFGKYNTGTPEDRAALAERLYDGMKRSTENVGLQGVGPISWRTAELRFHPREEAAFAGAVQFEALYDAKASDTKRIMAAMILAFLERTKSGKPFELSCLSIGQVKLLHLPGEPFVEYQLWAQRVRDADFVAVAGYGDCAMWYICTDRAYRNTGGYEQSWSFVRPSEGMIKAAMEQLLEGGD